MRWGGRRGGGTDLECAIPAVAGALLGVDGSFCRGDGKGVELERGDDDEGSDERGGGRDEEGPGGGGGGSGGGGERALGQGVGACVFRRGSRGRELEEVVVVVHGDKGNSIDQDLVRKL